MPNTRPSHLPSLEDFPNLMSVEAAAAEIGITPSRVYQLIKTRVLPIKLRVGGFYVLDRAVVEEFAKQNRPAGRPAKAATEQRTKAAAERQNRAALTIEDISPKPKAQGVSKAAITINDLRNNKNR